MAQTSIVNIKEHLKPVLAVRKKPNIFATRLTKALQKLSGDTSLFCFYVPNMDNKRLMSREVYRAWFMLHIGVNGYQEEQPCFFHFSDSFIKMKEDDIVRFITNNFVDDDYREKLS